VNFSSKVVCFVRVKVIRYLYSALLWDEPITNRSDMARERKGITQFYLPPTHEPYLPLLSSRQSITSLSLVLIAPMAYLQMDDQAELIWVAGYRFSRMGS